MTARPKVYTVDYVLKNAEGVVVDTSRGGEPLVFMEGAKQVVLGLEKAISGREAGETLSISVPPAMAYGERKEELVSQVPLEQFDAPDKVTKGTIFQTQSGDQRVVVRVLEVKDGQVWVDANHPLAGFTLDFEVEVKSVREASNEEMKQGFAS